jgi:hypothetical protein
LNWAPANQSVLAGAYRTVADRCNAGGDLPNCIRRLQQISSG